MVLIGYWPLNEDSGSTAYDHSGRENHGTVNSGGNSVAANATGPTGQKAYSFDGSNDYVDISSSNLDSPDSYSVSMWVKANSDDSFGQIFGNSGGTQGGYILQKTSGDGFRLKHRDGSTNNVNTSISNFADGSWKHLVAQWNGTQTEIWINGNLKSTSSISTHTVAQENDSRIGIQNDGTSFPFNGSLSEARFYNRSLTPREIQYLYTVSQRGRHVSSKKKS